jgi:hypothetical protein
MTGRHNIKRIGPVGETRVSKEAANAAFVILWEFLREKGKIPGISHDLVLEFADALGCSNQIIIED